MSLSNYSYPEDTSNLILLNQLDVAAKIMKKLARAFSVYSLIRPNRSDREHQLNCRDMDFNQMFETQNPVNSWKISNFSTIVFLA